MREMVDAQQKEAERQRKLMMGDLMKGAIDYKQRLQAEERRRE